MGTFVISFTHTECISINFICILLHFEREIQWKQNHICFENWHFQNLSERPASNFIFYDFMPVLSIWKGCAIRKVRDMDTDSLLWQSKIFRANIQALKRQCFRRDHKPDNVCNLKLDCITAVWWSWSVDVSNFLFTVG